MNITPEIRQAIERSGGVVTIELTRVHKLIGCLPATTMQKVDDCLKAALGLR